MHSRLVLIVVGTLLSAAGAQADQTCVLTKDHVLEQSKKKDVVLGAGDAVVIVAEKKNTLTVKAKGEERSVGKAGLMAVCEVVAPQVGVMPLAMKGRVRKADRRLLDAWHDQLQEAFARARPDVTSLQKSRKESHIKLERSSKKQLAEEKKRAKAAGVGHVIRTEVKKRRGRYTVRVFVVDLEKAKTVATSQQKLTKKSKAGWADTVVEELLPALPPKPEVKPAPEEVAQAEEASPQDAAAPDEGAAPDEKVAQSDESAAVAEEDDEGGSGLSTALYSLGAVTGGLGVVSLIGAAGLGSVALADSFALLPLDNARDAKNNRSFTMANVTDGLWVTTAVLGLTTAALLGSGFFLSPAEEGPEDAPDETATALVR